jgi:lipid-A-disaccharide synthase-like uncharacterized protein
MKLSGDHHEPKNQIPSTQIVFCQFRRKKIIGYFLRQKDPEKALGNQPGIIRNKRSLYLIPK